MGPVAGRRARVSGHARTVMGHLVGDWLVPASRVAAGLGVAWHTVHDAFAEVAAAAGVHVTDTKTDPPVPEATGEDNATSDGERVGADTDSAALGSGVAARPCRSVGGVLPPVAVLGLVGESGCGKSTLGRTIMNLERASSGSIRLAGQDITRAGPRTLQRTRAQVQMIFQDPMRSLDPRMRMERIVGEGLAVQGLAAGSGPRAWPRRWNASVYAVTRCGVIRSSSAAVSGSGSGSPARW